MKTETVIKVTLAVLFFLCLLDMPYGYYQFVRFLALIGFSILAYKGYEKQENTMTVVYVGLAILFQPLFKISLGRELWNIVDVLVGIGLIGTIFMKTKRK
jgi:hypothetical protein